MRTFIAIEVPKDIQEEIKKIQEKLPKDGCNLTKAHDFHITLIFLGEIDDKYISEIEENLSKIMFKRFSLSIDRIGFFPDENYIRVIWLGIKEHDYVKDLARLMNDKLDFKPDNRFHAHITLARVKSIEDRQDFLNKVRQIKLPDPMIKFKVNSFKLIKSELTPEGSVYTDLKEFKLVE